MHLSKTLQTTVLSFLCAFSALSAQAAPNLLQNGNFEAGAWADNTGSGWMNVALGSTAITGWTLVNNNVAWSAPGNADGIVPLDNHSLDLTGMGNINPNGGVTQILSTIAGQTYTLDFYMDAVVGYGIPASVLVQAGGTSQTFSKSTNGWQAYSLDFVAVGSNTAITLSGMRSSGTYYIGLDNVSVTTAVPEPETYAMLLVGLGLVGLQLRRTESTSIHL